MLQSVRHDHLALYDEYAYEEYDIITMHDASSAAPGIDSEHNFGARKFYNVSLQADSTPSFNRLHKKQPY